MNSKVRANKVRSFRFLGFLHAVCQNNICISDLKSNYLFFHIFYLDTAYHCIAYDQFQFDIISHIQNCRLISAIIPNLFNENKKNFINEFTSNKDFTNDIKKMINTKDFTFLSIDGYTSHKELILTSHIHSIINTMKDWCSKNQRHGDSKGFVIYAYSQVLKVSEDILKHHLHKVTCEDFHETVFVYNPTKQVFLLIRIAMNENLNDEIKLSTNDLMKFVLTFFDVLGKSGVKLINLLVTVKEFVDDQPKCDSCKHQIISIEMFSSSKSFDRWWEKKENKFSISVIYSDLNTINFSFFLERIVYLVDSLQLHCSIKQLTEATVTTLEQTETVAEDPDETTSSSKTTKIR